MSHITVTGARSAIHEVYADYRRGSHDAIAEDANIALFAVQSVTGRTVDIRRAGTLISSGLVLDAMGILDLALEAAE